MINTESSYCVAGGPFEISTNDGYLFSERLRKSNSYLQSWQQEWKLLWMRPSLPNSLDLCKLAEKKFNKEYTASSFTYNGCHNNGGFVHISTENEWTGLGGAAFESSVGDFINHAKLLEVDGKELLHSNHRDLDKLQIIMNAVVEKKLEPIFAHGLLSGPEICDPLLLSWDNPLKLLEACKDLSTPKIEIGSSGLASGFQTEPHNLSLINISHTGCTAWIVIHPSHVQKLLKNIGDCVYPEGRVPQSAIHCFFRNRNYSVTPNQLIQWGIKFTVIYQEEGDVLILLPGSLYSKCNITFCINSSMNYISLDEHDVKIVNAYKKCSCKRAVGKIGINHGIWIPELSVKKIQQAISKWACNSLIANQDFLSKMSPDISSVNPQPGFSSTINRTLSGFQSTETQVQQLLASSNTPILMDASCNNANLPAFGTLQQNGIFTQKTLEIQQNDFAGQFQLICNNLNTFSHPSPTSSSGWENSQTEIIHSEEFTSFVSSLIESQQKEELQKPDTTTNLESDQEKFICSQCGKGYHYKSHLNRHIYISHSSRDISVKCPICGKRLAHKYTLQTHRKPVPGATSRKRNWCRGLDNSNQLVNDGRKSCEICGERFVQISGYNRHMKMKHPKMTHYC